mgnify:CR=1 FL=1
MAEKTTTKRRSSRRALVELVAEAEKDVALAEAAVGARAAAQAVAHSLAQVGKARGLRTNPVETGARGAPGP